MKWTDERLKLLIEQGEGYDLEFKESFSKKIGVEICAFANGNGGKILLGITDRGVMKGVNTTQKTTQKTTRKQDEIIDYLREHPFASRKELAEKIDKITENGVKYNLRQLS